MPTEIQHGQVITRFGAELIVANEAGEQIRCTSRKKFDGVCCGDYVTLQQLNEGNAALASIKKRKNVLTRPDFRGKPRPVAANIDQLIIVMAWLPKPQWPALDRYIIAAHQLDITPLIVMNKSDLEHTATQQELAALEEYEQVGYTLIKTQVSEPVAESKNKPSEKQPPTNQGIDALLPELANKTSIFLGQSGVGKSTLSNCILPQQNIRTGGLSGINEGKHTTTGTTLYALDQQAKIIDSPGTRDYTLPGIDDVGIRLGYQEFFDLAHDCKFHNCTHYHEPDCEVRALLDEGKVPPQRYARYIEQIIALKENNK